MADVFSALIKNGHRVEDILHTYSIDQVYLYYEKCLRMEMEKNLMEAVVIANSISYAAPVQYGSRKMSSDKQAAWGRFMDSLDWEKVTKKEAKTTSGLLGVFGRSGVPVKGKKGGG